MLAEDLAPTPVAPEADYRPLSLVAQDMRAMDALIAIKLQSSVPLVGQVSNYIISSGGKRLRPALLLLMSKALGYTGKHHINLAAVVEFIHTATLLHDDVVDESTLRRGHATANANFGNAASVLVGDFLYSRAFQMMVECANIRVLSVLADATNTIAEGEVLQLMHMRNPQLDLAAYLHVIRSKTAKLFEASTRLAAILMDSPPGREEQCAGFGRHIGTAFQIVDDILDYSGQSQNLGKNLGDDLREGKVTLPLIAAMKAGSPAQQQRIIQAIEQAADPECAESTGTALEDILQIIHSTDAIASSYQIAQQEAALAIACLKDIPDSQGKASLLQLAQSLLNRTS